MSASSSMAYPRVGSKSSLLPLDTSSPPSPRFSPSGFRDLEPATNQSPDDYETKSEITSQLDTFSPDTTPVLHPVFIPDILHVIFKNFEPLFSTRCPNFPLARHSLHDRRCLLTAALTCKGFLNPALDSLWRYLDSILPLLKLFPSLKLIDGKYVVHGNIQVEDVERVSRYARRVKILSFQAAANRPAQHLYLQLSQLVPAPFFPSLRRLQAVSVQNVPDDMEGVFLALSPTLRVLTFENLTAAEDPLFGAFISSLAVKTTTSLTHLVLSGHLSTDTLLYIFEFEHLQFLELSLLKDINANVFTLLDKLEYLSNLLIDVQRCTVIPVRAAPPTSPRRSRNSFPPSPTLKYLKKLHVAGKPLDIMLVLSGTGPTHLQSFSVECYHDAGNARCSTIISRCLEEYVFSSNLSLRTLDITHHPPLTSTCHFCLTDLPSITSLGFLESISLETCLFSADIEKLEGILSAWPNLKILFLPLLWSDPLPTLKFLATLKRSCPCLQERFIPSAEEAVCYPY